MRGYKSYLRYLEQHRLFTFINVMGLSIALAFVILVGNLVYRVLTVDDKLEERENLYFLSGALDGNPDGDKTVALHYNMGNRIQSQMAGIRDWCAFYAGIGKNPYLKYNGVNYDVDGLVVKKNFFDLFSYPLVEGNRKNALADPNGLVLTERGARKIFGTTTGVIGKMVQPGFNPQKAYRITAVMRDLNNSLLPEETDVLVPFENMDIISWPNGIKATQMNGFGAVTLVFRMQKGFDPNRQVDELTRYMQKEYAPYTQYRMKAKWIPYSQMNLVQQISIPVFKPYSPILMYIYIFIGTLVLLLAVLNYISMSVAQIGYRAKEMATRRLLGSSQATIFWRMISEALLITFVAFVVGIGLAIVWEDFASDLLWVRLDVVASLHGFPALIYVLVLLIIGFLTGIFPAMLLSRYHALDIVKGTFRRKTKMIYQRILYVVQSGICIGLLGSVFYLVVTFEEAMSRPVGYRTDHLLVYSTAGDTLSARTFVAMAEKDPFVKDVTLCADLPISYGWNNTNDFRVGDSIVPNVSVEIFFGDAHFTSVFGLPIQEDMHPIWDEDTYYVCQSMSQRLFGNQSEIISAFDWKLKKAGVYPDFRQGLPFSGDRYTVIHVQPREKVNANYIVVHTTEENKTVKERIDALYQSVYHMNELDTYWYSDLFKEQTLVYRQFIRLLDVFTVTSIVIAMLGLMAFSVYYVGQRRRDMAIRKAFGSDNRREMLLIVRYTGLSLCLGLFVAVPFFVLPQILIEQVEDKITFIQPYWTYPVSFVIIIGLSLLIVWLVTRKVVNESPIQHLKSE